MNRDEAIEALELLRTVVGKARDDTAAQNWGIVWMLHGVTNGAGFVATSWLLAQGHRTPGPFLMLWLPIMAFNLASIPVLKRRRSGVRSFVETQIWTIWTAFTLAVVLMAFLNYFMGPDRIFLGPVVAVLAAVAFCSMASIVGPGWYAGAAAFVAAAVVMSLFPEMQFVVLGLTWMVTKSTAGWMLHRAKRRRLAQPSGGVAEVV
jgi:hypothetical protein